MREIKFRAWIPSLKKMGKPFDLHENLTRYVPDENKYDVFPNESVFLQFTDLYEHCNDDTALNKEIYEGDLVQFHNGQILAVEWNDDICQWQYSDGSPIHSGDSYGCFRRVVGNIYENPELLNSNA